MTKRKPEREEIKACGKLVRRPWHPGGVFPCQRRGVNLAGGQWWCYQHTPGAEIQAKGRDILRMKT